MKIKCNEKDGVTTRCKFKYNKIIYYHYLYFDSVDAHDNGMRMHPIALEETWKMTRCPIRMLKFLLTMTKLNYKMAYCNIFSQSEMLQQEF